MIYLDHNNKEQHEGSNQEFFVIFAVPVSTVRLLPVYIGRNHPIRSYLLFIDSNRSGQNYKMYCCYARPLR